MKYATSKKLQTAIRTNKSPALISWGFISWISESIKVSEVVVAITPNNECGKTSQKHSGGTGNGVQRCEGSV